MIEFRNVSKTYDTGTKAVKNANFLIRFQNLSSFFKKNIDQIWKIVLIFIL